VTNKHLSMQYVQVSRIFLLNNNFKYAGDELRLQDVETVPAILSNLGLPFLPEELIGLYDFPTEVTFWINS
jgi:hypothetical protein